MHGLAVKRLMPCSLHVGLEGSDGKHSHGNKLFMPSCYSRWWVPVLLIKSVLNNYLELSYTCLSGRVVPDQNSIKLRFSYLEIWLAWSIHVWKLFRHFSRIYCQVVICILKLSVKKQTLTCSTTTKKHYVVREVHCTDMQHHKYAAARTDWIVYRAIESPVM